MPHTPYVCVSECILGPPLWKSDRSSELFTHLHTRKLAYFNYFNFLPSSSCL
jgi:hypothetical protein